MDKIAEAVKVAEVNGFVAGLVDTGILKVASDEELAIVADVIAENLPEDYTMEDAMAIAAEVVDTLEGEEMTEEEAAALAASEGEDMVVEGSDKSGVNVAAAMAAYGELTLAKEAGDISEEYFKKEAASIQSVLRAAKSGLGTAAQKVKGAGSAYAGAMKGSGIKDSAKTLRALRRNGMQGTGAAKYTRTELAKSLGRTGAAYGGTAAAGLGGKALYDKYNR